MKIKTARSSLEFLLTALFAQTPWEERASRFRIIEAASERKMKMTSKRIELESLDKLNQEAKCLGIVVLKPMKL